MAEQQGSQSLQHQKHQKRPFLNWAATGLLAAWALIGVAAGGYGVVEKTIELHAIGRPHPASWQNPLPLSLGRGLGVLWFISLQLAFLALALGIVALIAPRPRPRRAIAYGLLVVSGVILDFVASWVANPTQVSFETASNVLSAGRAGSLLVLVASSTIGITGVRLLLARRTLELSG